jgi:hypothetical protein
MAEKRRQKLIYFGKRDDDIWNAIQAIPDGDQNFHMKEAFRMYFLGRNVSGLDEVIFIEPIAPVITETDEDHTDKIDVVKLTGSMMIR